MKKRILALLLVACMLVPLLPALPVFAQKGTLGQVGSSTTLYDDITFSETAAPMNYGAFLASDLASDGDSEGTTDYRSYILNNKNVTWSGAWSLGALVNGTYEKMEYIISFGNVKNTATSGNNTDWHTTTSGISTLLTTYMSGASASIWGANGIVMASKASVCLVRMPGPTANNVSGIAAYGYQVAADGFLGLSVAETWQDGDQTTSAAMTNSYVMIRHNDKIVFPTNATLDDRTTWGAYATASAFAQAIASLRLEVKAGDLVQFCVVERSDGGGTNPKVGLNPIVSTYASATATEPTATTTFGTDRSYTRGAVAKLYPAWAAENETGDTAAKPDTEENRAAYREYLLTCGKLTQAGNWRVGGYTGTNGAFEPISYLIPFTTNGVFNTTDTKWNNTTWYTTDAGYRYLTDLYVRDSVSNNTFGGIWGYNNLVLYTKGEQGLRASNNYGATFVARYTVPAGAGGQVTPTLASNSLISPAVRFCLVYDGKVIWPSGATLANSTAWATGFSTADEINLALNGLYLDVEPGKSLDFCATGVSNTNTKLNATVFYSNIPKSSVYSEDASFTVGSTPKLYQAFLDTNGLTDGDAAKAAYRTHLLENGRLTWSGAWSRGAVDMNTGVYEKLDRMVFIHGKTISTTAWADANWTTNKTTYEKMVDTFLAGGNPNLWAGGQVLQSHGDSLRFRLTGNEAQSGIFAYAYEIPADGGGLIAFGAATDTVAKVSGKDALPYENVHLMYICIMVNGTPVWPQGATRTSTEKWGNYADVHALNNSLADALIYTEAGDLVQLCVREKGAGNEYLMLDPVITFLSGANPVTALEAGLTLGSGFAVNFHATAENETVADGLQVLLNGQEVLPGENLVAADLTCALGYEIGGIAAKEMTESITYSFKNRADGHVYAGGSVTPVALLENYAEFSGDRAAETIALAKATLNYGAAAQLYFGTEGTLANAGLSEADRVVPSVIKDGSYTANATVKKTEGAYLHPVAATLLLDDVISMKLLINADKVTDPSALTVKTIEADGVAVESEWSLVPRGGDTEGKYFKIIINIPMVDYRSYLTLGVYENGILVSDLLTYGVGAYACRMYDKSENPREDAQKLNHMVDAILALGAAASDYYVEEHADPAAYADVRELDTGLALAPSLVQVVEKRTELNTVLENSPSHALLHVNKDLYVTNQKGEPIATLEEALDRLDNQVIPLLQPAADATEALAAHFAEVAYADMMLLSADPAQISALKEALPMLRAVLDMRGKDIENTAAVVETAALAATYVCLFDAEDATAELSDYLNHRYMIAWYEAADATFAETARLVTAGAGGILTTDRAEVEACLTDRSIWAEGSLGRATPIIGHQGSTYNPTTQPNTMEAFQWAIDNGATLFEMDVYLSSDNVPVVIHDTTVDGATNGTGKIEEMTLAEIKALKVDAHAGAPASTIPTLEEILEEYKGTGVVLNIEIKSGKTALIPYIVELINEYEFWDQCRVCCFSDYQVVAIREQCPKVPAAVISGSLDSFETLVTRATAYEGACFVKFDKFDYDNLQKLAHRGIGAFAWTPDADADIYNTYAEGVWSLCLNWVDKMSNAVKYLTADSASYSLTAGGSTELTLTATTYIGEDASTAAAEMVLLSGNSTLYYADGTLTATAAGSATVMFRMPVKLGNTSITVYVYTAPITVNVQ